jgi:hemerythrin-like domain-containing protein
MNMIATKSTDVLEREHEVIQKVIVTKSVVADRLDNTHNVETATLRDISAFLHDFSEQCHHAKQERFLFPLLEARGVSASGCPIAVLPNEHEKGRALLTQLDDATQAFLTSGAAKQTLVITLRALVRLYVDHIWKEDYILLPMADKVLSDNAHAKLSEQFDSIEAGLGAGRHRQLEGLSARLEHALAKEPIK